MPTIAFVNQKGGVGKTTSAVNIAAGLALFHARTVLLLDLDAQSNCCVSFGYPAGTAPEVRLGHLLELVDEERSASLPFDKATLPVPVPKLALIPGQKQIRSYFDPHNPEHATLVKRLIAALPPHDFVILDCPPALDLVTLNAILAAHFAVVPCEQSVYAVEGFADFYRTVQRLAERYGINPETFYHILVTKYDPRNKRSAAFMAHALGTYRDRLIPRPIRVNDDLNQAAMAQQTVFQYAPDSHGAEDYRALSELILAYEEARVQNATPAGA